MTMVGKAEDDISCSAYPLIPSPACALVESGARHDPGVGHARHGFRDVRFLDAMATGNYISAAVDADDIVVISRPLDQQIGSYQFLGTCCT